MQHKTIYFKKSNLSSETNYNDIFATENSVEFCRNCWKTSKKISFLDKKIRTKLK